VLYGAIHRDFQKVSYHTMYNTTPAAANVVTIMKPRPCNSSQPSNHLSASITHGGGRGKVQRMVLGDHKEIISARETLIRNNVVGKIR
jgi:hypothetical protein